MKRDFREYPECIFSTRWIVNKFTDCLNEANIFNEKIPYLVIHKGEKRSASRLEINLTFKDNIKDIITSKDANKVNKQLEEYILKKLNEIPNYSFNIENEWFIEMLDKTNEKHYKKCLVVRKFYIFNIYHEESKPITNNCTLTITIDTPKPVFEILGK